MTLQKATLLTALLALLAGCMVGPDYRRADAPVAPAFKEQPPEGWTPAAPADTAAKGNWWTDFHDPLLDELEPQVAVSNQTVRQSYANYLQAVAEVKVARAQLLPVFGLDASSSRSGGPGAATTGTTGRSVVTAGTLEGTASWSLDLWGQVRRLVEQNSATAQADEAMLANATLAAQTLLATTIVELRAADALIDIDQRSVAAYRDSLQVTQAQGDSGLAATPPSAVITARLALQSARANLIAAGVARAQYAHAIAVLVGRTPESMDIPHSTAMPQLPVIPYGVPSTLLERRPDIAAAERTMRAQNAAVGVAVAAYYPAISLSAAAGFAQSPLDGLLHASNHVWSLGANGAQTLLDFGQRHAEVEAARAAYEAAVASYRGTVLTAFEQVENDLSGLRILAEEATTLAAAMQDAVRGSGIALAEFKAGTVDYTTVAQAQATQLNYEQTALSVEQGRLLDAISLIGDLGGGWAAKDLHEPAHPAHLPAQ